MTDDLKFSAFTKAILDSLTPREREVLKTRFGMDGHTKPPGVQALDDKFALKMKKIRERAENRAVLFGRLEALDNDEVYDDLSDEAWWQFLEDTVTSFNEEHGTDFDPNDTVHIYLGAEIVDADKIAKEEG